MNNTNKQEALIKLGSESLSAVAKAYKSNCSLTIGATLCCIRASYEYQARAIINHVEPLSADDSYIVGPRIGEPKEK